MAVVGRLDSTGNLYVSGGIDTRSPMVEDSLRYEFSFDGTSSGIDHSPITGSNILEPENWVPGTSGSQPGWGQNGATSKNSITFAHGPFDSHSKVWKSYNSDVTSTADGGFISSYYSIDNTKLYRLSMWVKRTVIGDGSCYFGTNGSPTAVRNYSNTSLNGNPYFDVTSGSEIDDWQLWIGHVHPQGTPVGSIHGDTGRYNVGSLTNLNGVTDFQFDPLTTSLRHRNYLYYSTIVGTTQYTYMPRMDLVDGSEPSLSDLVMGREQGVILPVSNVSTTISDDGLIFGSLSTMSVPMVGTTFTYHFEFTPTAVDDTVINPIFNLNGATSTLFWTRSTENYYRFRINGTDFTLSPGEITQNVKSTITITSAGKFYVNGVLRGTGTSISTMTSLNLNFYPTVYGSNVFHKISVFESILNDVEIQSLSKSPYKINVLGMKSRGYSADLKIPNEGIHFPLLVDSNEKYTGTAAVLDTCTYLTGNVYVDGHLEFNLHDDYGLDWSGDWSIAYWKKPIGTSSGSTNLTGYSLDSIGCNSNSVGGGYLWWGKNSGSNVLQDSSPSAIVPATYFDNWHKVTMTKSGTTIIIKTYLSEGVSTRTVSNSTTNEKYYLTQYGRDLKLSGYDASGKCYTEYKDLLVVNKRALSDQEFTDYFERGTDKRKMKITKDSVNIEGILTTESVLT